MENLLIFYIFYLVVLVKYLLDCTKIPTIVDEKEVDDIDLFI